MKLKVHKREGANKGGNNRLRREGKIPAVIYSQGKPGENISIEKEEFSAVLRTIESGSLPATVFTLIDSKGHERRALVKGIQYHVTTYDVIHLDFEELHAHVPVKLKVPIDCTGVAECEGIKQGGALRPLIRHMRVRCLPKDIPSRFNVNVANLGIKQSLRLKSISIPEGVKPLDSLEDIVATISKR